MPPSAHQALHVVILLGFLAALGTAFVSTLAPLLFPDREGLRLPKLRTAIAIALGAVAGLGAEWLLHARLAGR
ncbi:MAG: hypothetical protein ACRDJF_02035 [Actinomycetota bacterium]